MRVRTAVLFLLAVRTACGWTSKRVHRPCLQPRKWTARFIPFTLQAVNDPEEEKRAAFVAGKGLEGSGPIVVVNKLAPIGFRYALYGLFSIVGVAGVAIAVTQGNPQDALLNGAGLFVAVGLAFLDISSQGAQIEATKEVMKNENLASGIYAEEEVAANDGGDGKYPSSEQEPRIQTAADLFRDEQAK